MTSTRQVQTRRGQNPAYDHLSHLVSTSSFLAARGGWAKPAVRFTACVGRGHGAAAGVAGGLIYGPLEDVTHLRRAKSLLQTYLKKHREIYENTPEAEEERQTTERRLAEVEQMLADAEAQAAAAPPMDGAIAEEPKAPALNIRQAKQDRLMEIRQTLELMKLDKRYKGMIVGGSVGAGLGLILIIASPVVAVQNVTEEFDGGGGGVDGSAAGVFWTGLLFTAVGVGILMPGVAKRKRLRRPVLTSRVTPYAGFGSYGVSATVNF